MRRNRKEALKFYRDFLRAAEAYGKDQVENAMRWLCLNDLFYLLVFALNRPDANRNWLYKRCKEVYEDPDGYLDLWAREHYKSTIITFALTIQDILKNPEETNCIFSHTRGIAQAFLVQIKTEFEQNVRLKRLFPDVLYEKPDTQSPKWNTEEIVVKRKGNPKECTLEAWGLVDGQPTSKHFTRLIYDDVVTLKSVGTPEQIKKTTEAWEVSLNLGSEGGAKRYIGTRYNFNDTYKVILKRGIKPRIYPATRNGKIDGEPVFMSKAYLEEKKEQMGVYSFGCQMLQDPTADKAQGFKMEWIRRYDKDKIDLSALNLYLLSDPAGGKKKENDYTVMTVIGLGADKNYYLIDGIRDRLNLTERAKKYIEFHKKYSPKKAGYEKYSMQADIEHIEYVQEEENYRFSITPLGGNIPKNDRIKKLVPIFENQRFYIPNRLLFIDCEGRTRDFVREFLDDEYVEFPLSSHDDMFDDMARIVDPTLGATFPKLQENAVYEQQKQNMDFAKHEYDVLDF
jgi:predicted phage terminase large subunit-like protein